MNNKVLLVSLAVMLALSMSVIGCGGEAAPEYGLTLSSADGGHVSEPGEASFTYDEGTVVDLVAEPDEGYRFVGWTGDVDNIADVGDAVTTVTINANCDISASFEQVGIFADPNLEAAIREAIGIPEGHIYPEDVEVLTSLHAYEMDIEDLTGLEHCVGLTTLYLHDNQIIDISPLGSLTALENLTLQGNQIADISPLVNLTNLVLYPCPYHSQRLACS